MGMYPSDGIQDFVKCFRADAPYGSLMKHADVTIVNGGWYISNDVIYINARVKATTTKAAGASLIVLAATREQIGGKVPDRLYPIICAATRGINWAAAYSNDGSDFYITLFPPSNIAITQNDTFDLMGFAI